MNTSLLLLGFLIALAAYFIGRSHGAARERALLRLRHELPSAPPVPGLDDFRRAEIARLVAEDRKIEAIKLYREATGAGLKEAKDAVERWSFNTAGPGEWPQLPGGTLR